MLLFRALSRAGHCESAMASSAVRGLGQHRPVLRQSLKCRSRARIGEFCAPRSGVSSPVGAAREVYTAAAVLLPPLLGFRLLGSPPESELRAVDVYALYLYSLYLLRSTFYFMPRLLGSLLASELRVRIPLACPHLSLSLIDERQVALVAAVTVCQEPRQR